MDDSCLAITVSHDRMSRELNRVDSCIEQTDGDNIQSIGYNNNTTNMIVLSSVQRVVEPRRFS